MEIFAPDNLLGVGMGSVDSVTGLLGLIGFTATIGMLSASGLIGVLAFTIAALVILQSKPDFGGAAIGVAVFFIVLLLTATLRFLLEKKARNKTQLMIGAPADAEETKKLRAQVKKCQSRAQLLAFSSTLISGAGAGLVWAQWQNASFSFDGTLTAIGVAVGVVAAAIGGDAAWRFIDGSLRAGGSAGIVIATTIVIAFVLNAVSLYAPFAGAIVLFLAIFFAIRLRRRSATKHAGLRILT